MTALAHPTGFPGGIKLSESDGAVLNHIPGLPAMGILAIGANVVAEDTFTIGQETLRIAVVNTDSTEGVAAGGLTADASDDYVEFAGHGLLGGDLIRIGTEIMRVLVPLEHGVVVKRAACGSTIGAHAADADIFTEATPGAGDIAVGVVTTLTPTAATPRIVASFNEETRQNYAAIAVGNNRADFITTLVAGDASKPSASADDATLDETASSGSNLWDRATMSGGRVAGLQMTVIRTTAAADVSNADVRVYFPFVPIVEFVELYTVADRVRKAYDGAVSVVGNAVVLDNSGSVDFAAGDAFHLVVRSN